MKKLNYKLCLIAILLFLVSCKSMQSKGGGGEGPGGGGGGSPRGGANAGLGSNAHGGGLGKEGRSSDESAPFFNPLANNFADSNLPQAVVNPAESQPSTSGEWVAPGAQAPESTSQDSSENEGVGIMEMPEFPVSNGHNAKVEPKQNKTNSSITPSEPPSIFKALFQPLFITTSSVVGSAVPVATQAFKGLFGLNKQDPPKK